MEPLEDAQDMDKGMGTTTRGDITVKKIDGNIEETEEDNNISGWGWFVTFKDDSDDKHLKSHG